MTPREVGIPVGEPFASFRLGDPSALEGLKVDPAPESAGGELPDSVRLTLVRADEASIFGGPALLGNRLVYGNSIGMIKACEIAGSRTRPEIQDRWTIALDHAASVYSTPLIAEDRLIVGSANGELLGLNLKDGSRAWSIPATVPISNDGTLAGGSLYMGLGTDEFCKIDPRTGRKIWSYKGVDGRFQGAPTVAYGTVVFGAWNQCLYALDEQTGRELWVWKGGREGNLYSPGNVIPVVSESQVVIVAPDRFMTAIDRKTGKQIWRDNSFAVRESTGSSPGGDIIYAKTMKGEVIAVSAKSDHFNLLWKCETGVTYDHVPCPLYLHGKTLYYGSPTGVVAAIDASSGQKLWSYKTGNSSVNRFNADEQGRVWFTLIEGKIYCIAPGSAVP